MRTPTNPLDRDRFRIYRTLTPRQGRRLVLLGLFAFCATQLNEAKSETNAEPADIFSTGYVGRLAIEIPAEGIASLRQSPRRFVSATVKEGAITYTNVAVHLKGRVGSFRSIDQNPSLTLNFAKFATGQTFHGFKKIHLNNSVQDGTFLQEKVSRDLFLAAGVPTPRAAHAVVQLNGSRPRLCVLIEGVNKQFLKRHFKSAKGTLYDGGFTREITSRLHVNTGENPRNQSGRIALVRAASEPDLDARLQALEKVLDVDRFLSFLAMEIMIAHWDGYALNVNNYRIYHDPDSDKMVFIPHGTDQVFHNTSMRTRPEMRGLVAHAAMEIPELRKRYLDRMRSLLTNVFVLERVTGDVMRTAERLRPFARGGNAEGVASLCRRIAQRHRFLENELAVRGLRLAFSPEGVAPLPDWKPISHRGSPELERVDQGRFLCILANEDSVASWRTAVRLDPGQYRFAGRVQAADLEVPSEDTKGGVTLRISRQIPPRRITADCDWTTLNCDFEVLDESSPVELICEFRGLKGQVCFDRQSLKVTRR